MPALEMPNRLVEFPTSGLPERMAEKTDSFRIRRKPGVERNHQIGRFDDMPITGKVDSSRYPRLPLLIRSGRLDKARALKHRNGGLKSSRGQICGHPSRSSKSQRIENRTNRFHLDAAEKARNRAR
jgi:hypothetical protein